MGINEQYQYQPYKGGAGPTEEQERKLNELLIKVLNDNNIRHTITKEAGVDPQDATDMITVGHRKVCYDRWGYISEDGVLEQADLADAFRYLAYTFMTGTQLAKWLERYPEDEEASELLDEYRMQDMAERESFGDPEDSPCLDQPWWKYH